MDIQIQAVSKEEEEVLHNLMQFYIYEFTKYMSSIRIDENGCFGRFDLDAYWKDRSHHAYFVRVDGLLAGFVLMQSQTEEEPNSIEEFFIMRGHEGKGIGSKVAEQIFSMFPGRWYVCQSEKNERARAFWRNIISKSTGGNFAERFDERNRSIQEFVIYERSV
ncbi:GNAT family N-acetyltransferase [Bacillus sp. REN16]|uniref:GNAT family N-acetyltransferase n=1 Tax=Bacillus sp. REN16 TaxID=2887296 RepID=UPI001E6386A5|nr:GNAT family N-acetyltransferase [Bacillus sp. REN16]MCC3356365.1 GNAT family N-acetyltransferase [Bacillus sp. REN16]